MTRKIRIGAAPQPDENPPMDKETEELLYMEAVDLAYTAFEDPDDDHVACIHARLVANHYWGLGADGATTVH